MLIASRDVQGPLFAGVLSGGNIKPMNGIKLIKFFDTQKITVIDSTKTSPLILKCSYYEIVQYSFIPMSFNKNSQLNVELVKN